MKPNTQSILSTILLISSIIFPSICYAVEVIRANYDFQGSNHPVDIALFDNIEIDKVGISTVENFLSYVNDGSYNNLLINRSVPGLIIQMGAYTFNQSLGSFSYDGNDLFSGGLRLVTEKNSITNQFKRSNLRGTIAMARIGGDIDSATNQWFINLTDNSFLDSIDEGFTVFGEVLGDGMSSIDQIAAIPFYDLSGEIDRDGDFTSVPLVGYTISSTITDILKDNLVIISGFDLLFNMTDIIDFGDAVINTTISKSIIIKNNNITDLQIASIDMSLLAAPFSLASNTCNTPVAFTDTCTIVVDFTPVTADFYADSFDVTFSTYGYTFPVLLKTPAPEITATPSTAEFGVIPVYDPAQGFPEQKVIRIVNRGDRPLDISSITFNTTTPDEFVFTDNCTAFNPTPPGDFCIFVVDFLPVDLFEKSATITVVSDDPVNAELNILITGGASTDDDGINNAIEDAAPNNGDGDNNGVPDRLQDNVVSFPSANGIYTTLITNEDALFKNVKPVELSSIGSLPDGILLGNEAFAFELTGFPVGSIAEFGLILPNGNSPTNIYSYGPTDENNATHWYVLERDASPGAIMIGNVSLPGITGSSISRNITTVRILDGGYGDSDLQVNGKILFTGGPEITNNTSSSSGISLWTLLLIPFLILVYRKN